MKNPEISELTIRSAEIEDALDLSCLSLQLGYENSIRDFQDRLSKLLVDDTNALFVAVLNGKVVGWIQAGRVIHLIVPPFVEIGALVVDEGQRKRGVGKALLKRAEEWAWELGLSSIWVRSNIVRTQAHDFYLDQGYHLQKSQKVFVKALAPQEEGI
jgi:GNAT superfamily N-acetyltransferase